jgi:hypothetical protein
LDITTIWETATTDITITLGSESWLLPSCNFNECGDRLFIGIIDTEALFDTITFDTSGGANSGNYLIGFDSVSYGQLSQVPEPASLLLLASGLAGLGFAGRKKKPA